MDFEMLNAEMNNLLKLMSKEGPSSDNYETYSRRLTELQEIALRWQELSNTNQNQKEDLHLKRREQDLAEDMNFQDFGTCGLNPVFFRAIIFRFFSSGTPMIARFVHK